ncbi:MAG TPA: ATP-dependent helicase [Thermodesulfobacteriota bacterium]|nr:ATP-dependent helicase [Thermodesulfobacteriota bacterium]
MSDTRPTTAEGILEGLDAGQKNAVLSSTRHTLIVAPPGSGKTRVLSARFALLVKDGVAPDALLAVTFTHRSAREMKERISVLSGLSPASLDVTTFHGFSFKLLKMTRRPFSLYGRHETVRLLKELGVKSPERAARMVSAVKNGVFAATGEDAAVFGAYSDALKSRGALDLDDLVAEAVAGLEGGGCAVSTKSHIMVDEYQDINPLQARLVRLLAKDTASVLAIGDPDQAIYSFRGASLRSFLEFRNDYPASEVINLSTNYRSGADIVTVSKGLIRHNCQRIENDPVAARPGGEIFHVECPEDRSEAEFIIKEIEKRMGGLTSLTAGDTDLAFSDFAVLVRTNRQADLLADSFQRSSLPYYRGGGESDRAAEFVRRLKAGSPGPGVTLEGFIKEEAAFFGLAEDITGTLLTEAGDLRDRPASEVLDEFAGRASLMEPEEYLEIKADRVSLLTLHMAKGLEFKTVFIAGFEDGLIPYVRDEETDIEEERRLFYVGMTRAKEALYLVSARKRMLRGVMVDTVRSRFLKELPAELVQSGAVEKKKTKKRPVQKGLFD